LSDIETPAEHSGDGSGWLAAERWLAAATMALLCLITFANVLVRYFTNYSFAFTEELSIVLMVVMALIGSSIAFATGRHIRITILLDRLPPSVQGLANLLSAIASVAMFVLIVWLGIRFAYDDYRYDVTTPALDAPQWLYSICLPLFSALILARVVILLLRRRDRF
jgi:TRAP-type C4-dicarboxylate transport system permease small subunit